MIEFKNRSQVSQNCFTVNMTVHIGSNNTFSILILLFDSMKELQGDAIAGTTVALTVIPQGLALAQLAELPPQVGQRHSNINYLVHHGSNN